MPLCPQARNKQGHDLLTKKFRENYGPVHWKSRGIEPDAETLAAFVEAGRADGPAQHGNLAGRTQFPGTVALPIHRLDATVRTKLRAEKHYAKARGTGDGRQPRAAVPALRIITGNRSPAAMAVQSLGVHAMVKDLQNRTRKAIPFWFSVSSGVAA